MVEAFAALRLPCSIASGNLLKNRIDEWFLIWLDGIILWI